MAENIEEIVTLTRHDNNLFLQASLEECQSGVDALRQIRHYKVRSMISQILRYS
jgi:hypothetical protein